MKDKIMLFIIGVLVGAIIATGAFFIYTKTTDGQNIQMNGGTPPEMPSGQNGEPPSMPNGDAQPPEMPNNN